MADAETSPGGSRIYRHAEQAEFTPPGESCVHLEALTAHIEKHVGSVDNVFHELISDKVHLDILIVNPTEERPFYTLVTSGMSDLPMTVPEGAEEFRYAELILCLPDDWPLSEEDLKDENNYWPIQWLKQIARVPHDYNTWIGFGHTIPNGDPAEPFAPNTEMNGILIAPARTVPDEFEDLTVEGGVTINFYALIPVHQTELEFKLEQGAEALLEILFEGGVGEILVPDRPNLIEVLLSGAIADDLEKTLAQMRANFGPAPRSFGFLARGSVRMKPPGWMEATNDQRFLEIYAKQDALLERGEIVWGHIIQANSELFGRGGDDCPANVLYSLDPKANEMVVELGQSASGLFELKGKAADDPELQQFADTLEDEATVTSLRIPIPAQATFDIQCQFAAIMVCRKHLPGGHLKGGLFPLLVLPEETKAAMILPGKYWPKEFVDDFWTD